MSKVRVVCDFMGGGFGDRSGPERYNVLAALVVEHHSSGWGAV
jgi:hypothetical protein